MTKKKHEELVEEIARRNIKFYHPYPSSIVLESGRDFVRECITLILSAVCDGRLDEELGVVGRHTEALGKIGGLVYRCSTLTEWEDEMAKRGAITIIALRGTGKEEG